MLESSVVSVTPEVILFREVSAANGRRIGYAQLNAGKSLNALSLPMIRLLDPQLQRWAADPGIACVVLHGAGEKAFCAGGDVRSMHQAIVDHRGAPPNLENLAFFSEEYRLDHRIHTYPKPVLVWGSGIVMGGGLGLMAGASHRVVTGTSRVAMPEITIGLFPDVGGSYFLNRMPRAFGLFLALTGASINGHDLLVTRLADHFVDTADRNEIFEQLATVAWTGDTAADRAALTVLLQGFSERAADRLPASNLLSHQALIEQLTASDSPATVYANLINYSGDDVWIGRAVKVLAEGSPTTAALVWELQKRAKGLSLAEVFRLELIVSLQCCAHPDLREGIRALLIDKDKQPRWTPSRYADLSPEWIAEHFVAPPWPEGRHPLADL
ncbi:MAG: enoyl-CoA hydratase/isomerase family protein [Hydrocarboniphaga sp.]|uniref:enoyl-CoA hydratase/isomerase family protein n=1 Tax=Hydrocarboniphaga sp. TaxID=2033016 RepID=UPI002607E02C|nr:enoyl-CoA hydratase/isomerase family protein [Hydrocarboniphaga sp.]MDB5967763.1 enoyl-CoA hydratase/isomerase family protein [Hydrocarboniphaga sp.]